MEVHLLSKGEPANRQYQSHAQYDNLAVASETEFAVSLAGQALGLFDLKQTLWITHIVGGAVAARIKISLGSN